MSPQATKPSPPTAWTRFRIWKFTYSLVDSRGRRIAVQRLSWREYWLCAFKAHRRMDMFVTVTATIVLVVGALFLTAFCYLAIVEGRSAWRWLNLLIPMGIAGWRIQSFRRFVASEIVVSRGAESRCFGCGYDLKEMHADADGCTVCPECGAAWKLNAPLSERVSE